MYPSPLCVPSIVLSYTIHPSILSLYGYYKPLLYHVPLSPISLCLLSSSQISCTPLSYLCVPSIILSYTMYPSPLSLYAFYLPLLYHEPLSHITECLLSSSPTPCTTLSLSLCTFYSPLLYHLPLSPISVRLLSSSPIPCTPLPYLCVPSLVLHYTMYPSPYLSVPSIVLSYTMYPTQLSLCTFYSPLLYHVPPSPISACLLSSSLIPYYQCEKHASPPGLP